MSKMMILLYAGVYFIIFPIVLGSAFARYGKNNRISIPQIYVTGYVTDFALMWVYLVCAQKLFGWDLQAAASRWKIAAAATGAAALLISAIRIMRYVNQSRSAAPGEKSSRKPIVIRLALSVIIILISIGLLEPSMSDNTIEAARQMMAANALCVEEGRFTYPQAFVTFFYIYTKGALDIASIVHIIAPFALLPLLFGAYDVMARILFPDDPGRQNVFLGVFYLFYAVLAFGNTGNASAAFLNIWNGTTLAVCVLIPLAFCGVVRLGMMIAALRNGSGGYSGRDIAYEISAVLAMAAGAFLFMPGGGMLCLIICCIGVAVAFFRGDR